MAASSSTSREYCLRWNNHQPNLVNFFGDLLHKESLVDVTLVSAEGKKLQAHKLVLSSCSNYFQHVFENNPCKHPVVILKDVQFSDLRTIINFIYNGEVNISQDRINTILATASTLQVKGLAEVPAEELKRVSVPRSSVGSESFTTSSSVRTQQPPPLQSSTSWAAGEDCTSQSEIPRKKLKKSASATVSSGSVSHSTNGEHIGSFDSGAGASMSRSAEDSGDSNARSPPMRTSAAGPPPLTAANPLLPKSRSLDHNIEAVNMDSELSSSAFSENHTFDDSPLGADRGPLSGKGRRGRPLLRQPRIKRVDNESGKETIDIYTGEMYENVGNDSSEPSEPFPYRAKSLDETSTRFTPTITSSINVVVVGGGSISTTERSISPNHSVQSSVPIVRVSQCSPTPPSSPVDSSKEEIVSVSVPTISFSSSSTSISTTVNASPTLSSSTTLLTVPTETVSIPTFVSSSSGSSSGSHLVKQISQPLLPSHTTSIPLGSSNPVIRRQHSQPSPSQHTAHHARLVPYSPLKRGTFFTLMPAENYRSSNTSSTGNSTSVKEEDSSQSPSSSPATQNTFILEPSSSYIQLVSQTEGNRLTIQPSLSLTKSDSTESIGRKAKKEASTESPVYSLQSAGSGSFSSEESVANDPLGDDGNPVQRSGHCPVLRQGPALGCNFCWNSVDSCGRIFRRKTKYHCPECHINLCIVPCFQEYHEKADKQKKKNKTKLGLMKPSSM